MAISLDPNFNLSNSRFEFNDIVAVDGVIRKITYIERIPEEPGYYPTHDNITLDNGDKHLPGLLQDVPLSYKILQKLGFKKLTAAHSNKRSTDYTFMGGNFKMIYTIANGQVLIQPRGGQLQVGKLNDRCVRVLQHVKFSTVPKELPNELKVSTQSFFDSATVHLKDLMNFDILIGEEI